MKTRVATSKNSAQFREWRSAFAGNPWAQEKPKAAKRGKTTSKVAKAIPTISGQESLKKCTKGGTKRKATHSATTEAAKGRPKSI
ncbi:hypothetical protein RchiOBHm_Chr5g0038261 [Rosa chinensis]|uniref:Uncharacterized protein n=1 Tax=Rosa chinensis TaxID=74649 RepID=A0A2P6QBZ5_ROSCH|nr:hypothetical protein RchiOBHm_Chr5g0038261 [Rosa chinensis]